MVARKLAMLGESTGKIRLLRKPNDMVAEGRVRLKGGCGVGLRVEDNKAGVENSQKEAAGTVALSGYRHSAVKIGLPW